MNQLHLFLPCAAGVEDYLATEVHGLTGLTGQDLLSGRGGVVAQASWRDAMRLNLHGRLAQRVLVQLSHTPYRNERDLYEAASAVAWEIWFTTRQTFKIEITAQHSPLTSLNFAALKIKDAVADRFRQKTGERPSVDTQWPVQPLLSASPGSGKRAALRSAVRPTTWPSRSRTTQPGAAATGATSSSAVAASAKAANSPRTWSYTAPVSTVAARPGLTPSPR